MLRFLWIGLLFLIGCAPEDNLSGPLQAYIIHSGENGYELGTVTIKTLSNLQKAQGKYAEIKGGAVLDALQDIGEIVASEDPDKIYADRGQSVLLDYRIEDNVVYPRNFSSMAILAMYYNFEKTFEYWRDNLGLSLGTFGVTTIYNNPVLRASVGGTDSQFEAKVNAAFLAGVRDLWFFKKSKIAQIPIKMNFGIMAHEFSHAVFDWVFSQKDPLFYKGSASNSYKLSAINEGLADYFAYMVTGRAGELGDSLKQVQRWRTLPIAWTEATLAVSGCPRSFYCLGSILASALWEVAQSDGFDALSVGKVVFNGLGLFRADWQQYRESIAFDIHMLLNRIIEADVGNQSVWCQSFLKWFDAQTVGEGGLNCAL